MREEEFLDQETFDAAIAKPLGVKEAHRDRQLAPYFAEEVRKSVEQRHGSQAVFEQGLQISTTLDPLIQRAAEEALRSGLSTLDHGKGWRGPADHIDPGHRTAGARELDLGRLLAPCLERGHRTGIRRHLGADSGRRPGLSPAAGRHEVDPRGPTTKAIEARRRSLGFGFRTTPNPTNCGSSRNQSWKALFWF